MAKNSVAFESPLSLSFSLLEINVGIETVIDSRRVLQIAWNWFDKLV